MIEELLYFLSAFALGAIILFFLKLVCDIRDLKKENQKLLSNLKRLEGNFDYVCNEFDKLKDLIEKSSN